MEQFTHMDQLHEAASLISQLTCDPQMSCSRYFKIRGLVSDLSCLLDLYALNLFDVGETTVIYKARLYKCLSGLYINLYSDDVEDFAVYRDWKNVPKPVREWIEARMTSSDHVALENGREVVLIR